ncbi:right-handed parallel beta-helix repeat-containing protein [Streptomyces sp. NBC_01477]|uniref:right-handed parallel beta-helix repeat-containing protein n=1 Tax=Streptomyces sp. NBC_01477 TaxID=2976015 RepID=UPI002E34E4AE|nr:right-handed parallel beta-helix repeat-containing protein [Streptomyces sp. NBC_01477]
MSHRRLGATAAFVAAGVALIPNVAQADSSPRAAHHTTAAATKTLSAATAPRKHHFDTPAPRSARLQRAASPAAAVSAKDATGTTIHVRTTPSCTSDTGDGTQAAPYCLIQDAVDAAHPGDTVSVQNPSGVASPQTVTVTTSGISIVGVGNWVWLQPADAAKPTLTLDGVSDVTVRNLIVEGAAGRSAVRIANSTGVTFDSGYVDGARDAGPAAVDVDGTSSGVTISRTYIDAGSATAGARAVSLAAGAKDVTLAANLIAASGVAASGVQGLNVTNNTIQRGCYPALTVADASTGVSVENNLFEDANLSTDNPLGGHPADCASTGDTWAADVSVSADSADAVTSDYNAFYVYGTDATSPYDWAGTGYPTLAAFQAATPQGAHDVKDTVKAATQQPRSLSSGIIDAAPQHGSAVIGSANPDAPGKPATDFYGAGSFTSRGAVEYVNPNPTLAVAITGGDDTSAYGGSLDTRITSASVTLTETVSWGDGKSTTTTVYGPGGYTAEHRYAKAGVFPVTVTVTDPYGNAASTKTDWVTQGRNFTAVGPTRLLDTRNGTGAQKAKVPGRGTVRVQIAGRAGVPAGVTAAVLNLTVTGSSAGGVITAYPDGYARPTTSNLNFVAGQTVPNLGIVPVGENGYVDLYNQSPKPVDLIADITGYYGLDGASYFQPLAPYRATDTRYGTGTPKRQIGSGGSIIVQIAGNDHGQIPSSGVTAVALNVTAVNAKGGAVLTVYPDGKAKPVASNLNVTGGRIIANAVVTPVGSDGRIRVALNTGAKPLDVVVDVVGYYSASVKGAYVPLLPDRWLDTRDPAQWSGGPLGPGEYAIIPFAPDEPDFTGVVLNTTVVNTTSSGWLGVAPDPNTVDQYNSGTEVWPPTPVSSTLNWVKGQIVPNMSQASLGKHGIVDFFNRSGGKTDLVVDLFGYYQND